jgi:ABC-type polysaccharide transport system permease subunit
MIKQRAYTGSSSRRHKEGVGLFLLCTPFFLATFVFSYLPLFGWSYAFLITA